MVLAQEPRGVIHETVLSLLKSYGEDSLSYFHLQHERNYFFSPSGQSFLSYKVIGRVILVGADPVGPEDERALLFSSFLSYTREWKYTPLFIGLSKTNRDYLQISGLKSVKIGEEAVIHLPSFEKKLLKKKVRRAVRHIEEEGIEVFFFNPTNIPHAILTQVEAISSEWIKSKGGKEKGFSMTLKRFPSLEDTDCQIVVAIKKDMVLGYLCFVPAYQTKTLSLDQSRKRLDAPNGLNEFLIVKSAEYFKTQHIQRLSLNFATFSNRLDSSQRFSLKQILSGILEKTYRCSSLRSFNEKFHPTWESRYVAYTAMKHLPLCLLAVLKAER